MSLALELERVETLTGTDETATICFSNTLTPSLTLQTSPSGEQMSQLPCPGRPWLITRRLDQAENAALLSANQNKKSYNLDDTGFFSISVLERALQVWDLTLVRWRGEAMRPYQDEPE